jgi:hypothetical protein
MNTTNPTDFHIISSSDFINLLKTGQVYFKIFEEELLDENFHPDDLLSYLRKPKPTGRYHLFIETNVTQRLVGRGTDNLKVYMDVPWELLSEKKFNSKSYLIFSGAPANALTEQGIFNYHQIGIEKELFPNILSILSEDYPDLYPISKLSKVIGLENFKFLNGKILI